MLNELKKKITNETNKPKKTSDNNISLPKTDAPEEAMTPTRTGSVKCGNGIMWYTGPERRGKSYRYVDEFPNRLPLEPLSDFDRQGAKFELRPDKPKFKLFKPEPLLLEMKEEFSSLWTDQQKEWRKNAIKKEDLTQELGRKVKSHNRLKKLRYTFWTDVLYSKNGLLYYLLPLLFNIYLMIFNFIFKPFWENIILATVALIPFLILLKTIKGKRSSAFKFIITILTLLGSVLALSIIRNYAPEFYAQIYYPYVIKIFLIYLGIYWFGKYYVIWHIMYVQDLMSDFGNVFKIKGGKPRVGKTSQSVQEAKALALQMWRKLQYDFWTWHSREKEILARGNIDELLEWFAIKESYLFYTKEPKPGQNKGIPCLWSNIGIKDDAGRTSYKVTLKHIRGTSRLPLYSVVMFDEIGAVLKNELSFKKGEYYDVSDMFRLGGHFLKWAVIACEQDPKNIYIDCRRVAGVNEIVKSQQWVCKPTVALAIFNFLKIWKTDSLDKGSKRQKNYAKFMLWFEKFVKSIGFRKQIVSTLGNFETGSEAYVVSDTGERIPLGKNKIRYVASGINKYYNDRAYKQLYPSYFTKNIDGVPFENLTINGFDLEHATEFVSSTEQLNALRHALSEKIKEIA